MPVTQNKVVTTQAIAVGLQQFVNADGTAIKDLFTAGVNGSIVNSLVAQSTDPSSRNLKLYYYDGTTSLPIGTIAIAANSGNNGTTASVNLLTITMLPGLAVDSLGNICIRLAAGHKLQGSLLVAVTSGQTISVLTQAENL